MVASKAVNKHQTNTDDNRGTITIYLSGLASVVGCPFFYLVNTYKIDIETFKSDFANKHKAPPGLKLIPTPKSYITGKVWNDLAPDFAKGLRDLPVIKYYPELWMAQTLDGHGFHLQGDALKIFADYKILIVKKEEDTS